LTNKIKRVDTRTESYHESERLLTEHLFDFAEKVPREEVCENLQLFITPQHFRRIFFFSEIYKLILDRPGSIYQFGVRWGREMALFESLRTLHEPFNHSRRIIGFDTFTGYEGVSKLDGGSEQLFRGNLAVSEGYFDFLSEVLLNRENFSPVSNVRKFALIKGDINQTLSKYLEENPHELISLLHLDLNLYQPTLKALELVWDRVFKGSVVVIDELNCPSVPGETIALKEFLNLRQISLRRLPGCSPTWPAYFIVD